MEQLPDEIESFLMTFEKLCRIHGFFLNGTLGEFKPQAVVLPKAINSAGSLPKFIAAYRELCFDSGFRIDCLLVNDELVVVPMGPDSSIDEAHFEELLEAGSLVYCRETPILLQMEELRFNTIRA